MSPLSNNNPLNSFTFNKDGETASRKVGKYLLVVSFAPGSTAEEKIEYLQQFSDKAIAKMVNLADDMGLGRERTDSKNHPEKIGSKLSSLSFDYGKDGNLVIRKRYSDSKGESVRKIDKTEEHYLNKNKTQRLKLFRDLPNFIIKKNSTERKTQEPVVQVKVEEEKSKQKKKAAKTSTSKQRDTKASARSSETGESDKSSETNEQVKFFRELEQQIYDLSQAGKYLSSQISPEQAFIKASEISDTLLKKYEHLHPRGCFKEFDYLEQFAISDFPNFEEQVYKLRTEFEKLISLHQNLKNQIGKEELARGLENLNSNKKNIDNLIYEFLFLLDLHNIKVDQKSMPENLKERVSNYNQM